jgi:peroxiredoxin
LQGLQSRLDDFKTLNTAIVAICVDSPEQNAGVVKKLGLEFPILSDPDFKAINTFGVLHENGMGEKDISRPAVFVLDEEGRVMWKSLTDNYRVRVRPSAIIDAIGDRGKTSGAPSDWLDEILTEEVTTPP